MTVFAINADAQYYNPYYPYANQYQQQQANRQAYEWGQQLAKQFQSESDQRDRGSLNACFARMGTSIAKGDYTEAKKWAGYLRRHNNREGLFYLGLTCDLLGKEALAKSYYRKAMEAGQKNAAQWLQHLESEGCIDGQLEENIRSYYQNLHVQSSLMASQITNSIWGSSSTSERKSRNSSSYSSRSSCPKCHGRRYESTAYNYAAASASGWMPPYHHTRGKCSYCNRTGDHYHYPCTECHGHGQVKN